MLTEMRRTFGAGLLVIVPLALTTFIFIWLFQRFDGILSEFISKFITGTLNLSEQYQPIPGMGILLLFALIFLAGTIARNYIGGRLLALGDYIVTHIPIINRIYIAIREISEALLTEKREVFKKAVIVEYPRKGMYSIGFFTQDTKGPVQEALDEDVVSVLLLTSPNPTSGYLIFVPKDQVIDLNMPVEDALKLVISAGSVHLKEKKAYFQIPGLRSKKIRIKEFPSKENQNIDVNQTISME